MMELSDYLTMFRQRVSTFNAIEDYVVEDYILDAIDIAGTAGWGTERKAMLAVTWLAAHNLQRNINVEESEAGGNVNPKIITSESYGDTSISRGGVNVLPKNYIQDELNTTQFGFNYLKLLEARPRPYYLRRR